MQKKALVMLCTVISISGTLLGQPKSNPSTQMQPSQGCKNLPQAERGFASQLMDQGNRNMFCTQFTAQQRQMAMQMAGQVDDSGNVMSADQAVQKVMQSSNMAPPASAQPKRPGGGCPVQ